MSSFTPPNRREYTLIVFCLTVFTLAYNLETSIRHIGIDPARTQSVLGRLGLGRFNAIDHDGRKLPGYRDELEKKIYGNWAWDAGYVAGDGQERSQEYGAGPHGAMWLGPSAVGELRGKRYGTDSVSDGFWRWDDEIPQTKLVKHVPGKYPYFLHVTF